MIKYNNNNAYEIIISIVQFIERLLMINGNIKLKIVMELVDNEKKFILNALLC